MKAISYIRIILFTLLAVFLLIYLTPSENFSEIFYKLWFWVFVAFFFLASTALEICINVLRQLLYQALNESEKEQYDEKEALVKANQFRGLKNTYKKLLGSKPIHEEHEIILDHNYDGIKELDNDLPPWWLYGFYATIIFAIIYMVRFHVYGGYTQAEEYETEVAIAKAEIEIWKKTAKDLVDVNTVTLLTEKNDLNAGKNIFTQNCVACHKADGGGGIGPNLTDPNWILGGGIKNVFKTISEGGRDGKGMVPWKSELKPSQIAQVASYVLSLEGTNPIDPKDPEGDIWIDPNSDVELEVQSEETFDEMEAESITPIETSN